VAVATGTSEVLEVATNDTSVVETVKVVGWAELAGRTAWEVAPDDADADADADVGAGWEAAAEEAAVGVELMMVWSWVEVDD
jgi:hypothetical protein